MHGFPTFLLTAAAVVSLVSAAAAADMPAVDIQKDRVVVTSGAHNAAISMSDARIELQTPYRTYHMKSSILHQSAWTEPSAATAKPVVRRGNDSVAVEVTFPVPGNREFIVELSAYRDVPGIYMLSRLKNLGGFRSDYYYWYWEGGYDSYFAPGENGVEKRSADTQGWTRFGYSDWVYLPGEGGGLAAFTKGTLGRGPTGDPQTFLNALPNNQNVLEGHSLDMGIGLVGAKSPEETAKLYALVTKKRIAAASVPFPKPLLPKIDYGKPAPEWARNMDKYNIFPWFAYLPTKWTDSEIHEWLSDFPVMEAVPADKDIIARCHKAGLHVLMYVNFMEMLDAQMQRDLGEKGKWYLENNWMKQAGHELVDLHDHPNWVAYNSDGKPMQSVWGAQTNVPGLHNTCFQQPDLHETALKQLKVVMDLGVDGIFIDNAADVRECYGDKFGKHKHPSLGKSNTDMYMLLMQEVYKFVKSYGDDRVVMHNSGINPPQWAFSDIQMCESQIYGSGVREKMNEWESLQYTGEMQAEALKHGKVPVTLNYFLDQPDELLAGRALYTYAYARLYGFGWGDWFTLMGNQRTEARTKIAKSLYSVRLGKPTGEVRIVNRVFYRAFENGIVAVNTAKAARTVSIPVSGSGKLADTCYDRTLTPAGGKVKLDMGPETGRVLVWGK